VGQRVRSVGVGGQDLFLALESGAEVRFSTVGLLQHACRLRNGAPAGRPDRPFFFRPLETVQRLLQDYF